MKFVFNYRIRMFLSSLELCREIPSPVRNSQMLWQWALHKTGKYILSLLSLLQIINFKQRFMIDNDAVGKYHHAVQHMHPQTRCITNKREEKSCSKLYRTWKGIYLWLGTGAFEVLMQDTNRTHQQCSLTKLPVLPPWGRGNKLIKKFSLMSIYVKWIISRIWGRQRKDKVGISWLLLEHALHKMHWWQIAQFQWAKLWSIDKYRLKMQQHLPSD